MSKANEWMNKHVDLSMNQMSLCLHICWLNVLPICVWCKSLFISFVFYFLVVMPFYVVVLYNALLTTSITVLYSFLFLLLSFFFLHWPASFINWFSSGTQAKGAVSSIWNSSVGNSSVGYSPIGYFPVGIPSLWEKEPTYTPRLEDAAFCSFFTFNHSILLCTVAVMGERIQIIIIDSCSGHLCLYNKQNCMV